MTQPLQAPRDVDDDIEGPVAVSAFVWAVCFGAVVLGYLAYVVDSLLPN